MTVVFERRLLSAHLLGALTAQLNHPVGLAMMPADAGWSSQPRAGASEFRPYSVLTPLTASTSEGPWGDPQSEWMSPYAVTTYGAAPEQTEWQADRARQALCDVLDDVIDLGALFGEATVIQVWVMSIGTLTHSMEQVDYGFWGQTDTLSIRLSKN